MVYLKLQAVNQLFKMNKQILVYTSVIIVGINFFFWGLVKGQGFLVPFTFATILSMVLLPVERKLRKSGISKGFSIFLSDFLLFGFCVGLFFIIGWQIEGITENWPDYRKKLEPKIEQVQEYITEKTGISKEEQVERLKKSQETSGETAISILPGLFTFSGNFLLVFVYIFFFMYYRTKFKNFILRMVADDQKEMASDILHKASHMSQQYLSGRFIIIIFLAVVYYIGLAIIGIRFALLIGLLAAVLTLIPYIGNIIGVILALAMSLLTDSPMSALIGIIVLFSITQFFESYFLEPYVVGHKVDMNPVVIIVVVVIGGMVWGFAGMFLSIPLLGILKAVFDHVPVLNPLGYMLNEEDTGSEDTWPNRVKNWIMSKIKKK